MVAITARVALSADKEARAATLAQLNRPSAEIGVALDVELVKPPDASPPPPPSPPPVVSIFVEGADEAVAAPAAAAAASSSTATTPAAAAYTPAPEVATQHPPPPPPSPSAARKSNMPMMEISTASGAVDDDDDDDATDSLLARTVSVRLVTASTAEGFPATAVRAVLGARTGVNAKRVALTVRPTPSGGALALVSLRCRDAERASDAALKLRRLSADAFGQALGLNRVRLEGAIVHEGAAPPPDWAQAPVADALPPSALLTVEGADAVPPPEHMRPHATMLLVAASAATPAATPAATAAAAPAAVFAAAAADAPNDPGAQPTANERGTHRPRPSEASGAEAADAARARLAAADAAQAAASAELSPEERAERRLAAAAARSLAAASGADTLLAPSAKAPAQMGVLLSGNFTIVRPDGGGARAFAPRAFGRAFASSLARVLNMSESSIEAEADDKGAPLDGATVVRAAALLPPHELSLQAAVDAAMTRLRVQRSRLDEMLAITLLAEPTFATAFVVLDSPGSPERPGEGRRQLAPPKALLRLAAQVGPPTNRLRPAAAASASQLAAAAANDAAPNSDAAKADDSLLPYSLAGTAPAAAVTAAEASSEAAAHSVVAAAVVGSSSQPLQQAPPLEGRAASSPSPAAAQPLLANVTVRGELASFDVPAFSRRLAGLLGIAPEGLEVLGITPKRALGSSQREAVLASQQAVHAAAALQPEALSELPPEVAEALRKAEAAADEAADAAGKRAAEPPSLLLRLSASVPHASLALATSTLHSEASALSAALGVEVLKPVAFATGGVLQSRGGSSR